ncbi:MAG: hypothetical protein VYB48_00435 [Pseudomonadota bacterium]|nr:hypothetical protein [Pseudomonadota bacterium]
MNSDIVFLSVFTALAVYLLYRIRRSHQLAYIENYRFFHSIGKKIQNHYPHLNDDQIQLVLSGLREYFYICKMAKGRMVSMPSQVVDVAWHEFILYTRPYEKFCKKGLGRFLHHTPTEAMSSPIVAQDGIKRAWRLSCARRKIDPARPAELPLLFSIDKQLNIEDGFIYSKNCMLGFYSGRGNDYCAAHIGCASGCAGSTGGCGGFFGGSSDSDGGGGCGGGD